MVLIQLISVGTYVYFLYAILVFFAWMVNLVHAFPAVHQVFPYSIDPIQRSSDSSDNEIAFAIVWNVILLARFSVIHSVLARASVKESLSWLPTGSYRSVYVLHSSWELHTIAAKWVPMFTTSTPIWNTSGVVAGVLVGVFASGCAIMTISMFALDHFEMMGISQAFGVDYSKKCGLPSSSGQFQVKFLYRFVRHPLMTGFLLTFWSVPTMTWNHAVFSSLMSMYIGIAVTFFEEPDLIRDLGMKYVEYMKKTPSYFPRLHFLN
eukprot:m.134496 g.134496  ORF g.134496 m.134496 type:complete len:264 (-) comp29743_c0_seq1:62-853(-)